jgi:hypothetical protein
MKGPRTLLEKEVSLKGDARWLLVERIVTSQTFSKSSRLPQFLSYVCERTLTGRADEVNEQTIGEQVFERPPGYDPGQDNIVRVQASRLRQRLETYFNEEGAGEELRVIIPKGGYVPRFEATQVLVPTESRLPVAGVSHDGPPEAESALMSAGTEPAERGRRPVRLYALILCFLVLNLLGFAYLRYRGPGASVSFLGLQFISVQKSPDQQLWQQMFQRDQTTLIVPGDSGLVLYESQANQTVSLAQYLSGDVQTVPQINPSVTFDKTTSKISYRYTSIVDLQIVSELMRLPEAFQGHTEIRYARDLKLGDLKGENVVLIGEKDANPWVELFEKQMNYSFDIDRTNHFSIITNRNPQPGEPSTYSRDPNDSTHLAYALVALLPNLNRTGNVLILEGTTMAGTEAASDFAIDENRLAPLLQPYMSSKGALPHFEVLLQTSSIGGGAPESKVLAFRIHND